MTAVASTTPAVVAIAAVAATAIRSVRVVMGWCSLSGI
jgi:hypothetical protein